MCLVPSFASLGCDRALTGCDLDASPDDEAGRCGGEADEPPEEALTPCEIHEGSDTLFDGQGVCVEGTEERSGGCERDTWGFCGGGDGVQFCESDLGGSWTWCATDTGCTPGEIREEGEYEEICGYQTFVCESFGGVRVWREIVCNTPLVMRFDDVPVQMTAMPTTASVPQFAIAGEGSCTTTDWPAAHNPWLVLDRDGDGVISSGAELFGSGSPMPSGARPAHGFEPLAMLDHNGDGRLDANDPAFANLQLWRDTNGDRISQPDELSTLAAEGVSTLSLDMRVEVTCDARGNCGRERALVGTHDGRTAELVDMHLPCR